MNSPHQTGRHTDTNKTTDGATVASDSGDREGAKAEEKQTGNLNGTLFFPATNETNPPGTDVLSVVKLFP